jgi:hypothetical protein
MANVYVLQGENCFSEDGEVCWIEGVYSSEAKAEVAKRFAEDACAEENPHLIIYGRKDTGYRDGDWDRCWTVIEHPVQ